MKWRVLRPAGEPLPRLRLGLDVRDVAPEGYEVVFTQSGTAALALALLTVAGQSADPRRRRVLLPAYGCPDLVAATVFAGLEPELVDTAPDSPFLSKEALQARLGADMLAVVGAHFLGLAEDMAGLRALCEPHGVAVIEDSAQKVPGSGGISPVADLVVMSFGRGKPAGALGGGALLVRSGFVEPAALRARLAPCPPAYLPVSLLRQAYNRVIRPAAYGLFSRLPGLDLGVTRYKPLHALCAMDPGRRRCALAGWRAAALLPGACQETYQATMREIPGLACIPAVQDQAHRVPLSRFPILVGDAAKRDPLVAALSGEGLGATAMYGECLATLAGLTTLHVNAVPNARSFAARLVTLPLHGDVSRPDVERMSGICDAHAGISRG